MQLFANTLDLPDALLKAHEEGKLVLFCGAGVSAPAKLYGFGWLAEALYRALHTELQGEEAAAHKEQDFDIAIAQLEQRVPGQRARVRAALFDVLQPDIADPAALATHRALLQLARTPAGGLRLVTTNFDRLFLMADQAEQVRQALYAAPLLPLPKNDWQGVIHLHGLLPETPERAALDQLVLTSADFGLAYLVEGWAARFVTELFRRYSVCFVGYGINDKVMRYMLDAFAAERQKGEALGQAFVFAAYDTEEKAPQVERAWRAKNVVPILYHSRDDHAALHGFLHQWANHHAAGAEGRKALLTRYAQQPPPTNGSDDGCIGRVLWALDEPTGSMAKFFAELEPVPPAAWLEAIGSHRFQSCDGARLEDWLASDRMLDFSEPARTLFGALSTWLVRHLASTELLLWIGQRGARHPWFLHDVERRLLPQQAPLSPVLRSFWSLVLAGRIGDNYHLRALALPLDLRLQQDGLDAGLRFLLRQRLQPRIRVSRAFPDFGDVAALADEETHRSPLRPVDFELVFGDEQLRTAIELRDELPSLEQHLPDLLPDFDALLVDALALMNATGLASPAEDRSEWHQPSIAPHPQNFGFRPWTVLIELARDAWCALRDRSPQAARAWPEIWRNRPYPVFKRLALFALANAPQLFRPADAVDVLLADDGHCLWHPTLVRETLRLLHALGGRLEQGSAERMRLESAILQGELSGAADSLDSESTDGRTLHRLAKLAAGGQPLGARAAARLRTLQCTSPNFTLHADERDEFCVWLHDGDAGWEREPTPDTPDRLAQWLHDNPTGSGWRQDDFDERCRTAPDVAAAALFLLASHNDWTPTARWETALHIWSAEEHIPWAWASLAPHLLAAPENFIEKIASAIAWWLRHVPAVLTEPDERFLALYDRIQQNAAELPPTTGDDWLHTASNAAVGLATSAFMDATVRWTPTGNPMPDACRHRLTQICNPADPRSRAPRTIVAQRTGWLYRTEPAWTAQHLLPFFKWQQHPDEALAVWYGFCMSPPYDWQLISAMGDSILETTRHVARLGPLGEIFVSWFTHLALQQDRPFDTAALREATAQLDDQGLTWTAQSLAREIRGAGKDSAAFWEKRLKPYVQHVWPQDIRRNRPGIAREMAKICELAVDARGDAEEMLRYWMDIE